MPWRKEQIITVLLFALSQSTSTCTSVQWWPLSWGHWSQDVHIQLPLPVLMCCWGGVTSRWLPPSGAKGATAEEESAFFVLIFFAWMSRVDSWPTLCPVLLSIKWGNNAYLIRMLQELCKTFGKCFRNGKHCHSGRGNNFSCFWVFFSFFFSFF